MKLDLLKAKLKAAKAERIIRARQYNAAERGLIKVCTTIHQLEKQIEAYLARA
ncbi:hypothetical protein UFOVP1362_19 [uncultured Caudovirales phage]|uniref:Uncharacterized protein n=1 Tax=uncultured Caudovirales phage TaxID=2100421 RepID=A0A6J5QS31_9CAUD|nr:hypothetical protein UFOVP1101_7 [uncultured Caudovirales phage]CAB4201943.1 hypothetical protein UFOVP1362_19 [uncultured Caudovirales phage]